MANLKIETYYDFMHNPNNKYKCSECPENMEYPETLMVLPCGQRKCLIIYHHEKEEGKE